MFLIINEDYEFFNLLKKLDIEIGSEIKMIDKIRQIAAEAGKTIMKTYSDPIQVASKEDNSIDSPDQKDSKE